jgi:hypothetical protein
MFTAKIFLIFSIWINENLIKDSSSFEIPHQRSACLIRNIKYKNEYLYSSLAKNDESQIKTFTNEIDPTYMSSPLQPVWIIEPADYENSTYFYMSNFYYSEYILCATSDYVGILGLRRKVGLESFQMKNDCLWRFEKIARKKKTTSFYIWNLKYNQPLFAASFFFKMAETNRRNVYLWSNKPDSTQFNWDIDCGTQDFFKNFYI